MIITTGDYKRGEYPHIASGFNAWVSWSDMGRKQPFCPYSDLPRKSDDGDDQFSWSNPENLTDFETARDWARKHPQLDGIGFILQHESDPYKEPADPLVFIDLDDVVAESGHVHPYAAELVARTDTYADLSVSDTGIHIIGVGELPEGIRTIQDDLPKHPDFPDAEIEVYDRKRFCAMTGKWLRESNRDVTDIQYWVRRLTRRFDTTTSTGNSTREYTVDLDNADFADVEMTDDFKDIQNAINSVSLSDIRLKSTKTRERNSGVVDFDPSYRNSSSGTGLAWFDDRGVFVDRDGQHYMDALQLVALEERIITRPTEYPQGEAFWKAVQRLRDRGANIPRFTGSDGRHPDYVGLHEDTESEADEREQFLKALKL